MSISFIDTVFLVIILLLAVICMFKGFIKEVLGKGAVILGIWAAILFYKLLVPYLLKYIHLRFLAIALSFLLVFLVVYLIVMIIRAIVGAAFQGEVLKGLDRTLGFVLGALEGLAVVAVILIVLAGQPWFDVSDLLSHSFFYKILKLFIAAPVDSLSHMVDAEKIIPIKNNGGVK